MSWERTQVYISRGQHAYSLWILRYKRIDLFSQVVAISLGGLTNAKGCKRDQRESLSGFTSNLLKQYLKEKWVSLSNA